MNARSISLKRQLLLSYCLFFASSYIFVMPMQYSSYPIPSVYNKYGLTYLENCVFSPPCKRYTMSSSVVVLKYASLKLELTPSTNFVADFLMVYVFIRR